MSSFLFSLRIPGLCCGVIAGLFNKQLKERQVIRLVVESFGMPLHAQKHWETGVFDCLDSTVGRRGDDPQVAARSIDRLLMAAVGIDLRLAEHVTDA